MTEALILGVDGGGSGCRVAIAQMDGTRLAEVAGGPANVTSDADGAMVSVRSAIGDALHTAGVTADALAAAHLGLAGVLSDTDTDALAQQVALVRVSVSDDRLTTLVGALGDRDGSVVSVGTGSFVAHRSGGVTAFLGGWGMQISDQASGAWLGRSLLERVVLAQDGVHSHTDLTRAVLAQFGGNAMGITRFASAAKPNDYAGFAQETVAAALAGDATGRALMIEGAAYLDRCLALGADSGAICLAGSLAPAYAPYLESRFQARLATPKGNALDGALALARQAVSRI